MKELRKRWKTAEIETFSIEEIYEGKHEEKKKKYIDK